MNTAGVTCATGQVRQLVFTLLYVTQTCVVGPATSQGTAALICASCTQSRGAGMPSKVTSTLPACVGYGVCGVDVSWMPCGGPSPFPPSETSSPAGTGPGPELAALATHTSGRRAERCR